MCVCVSELLLVVWFVRETNAVFTERQMRFSTHPHRWSSQPNIYLPICCSLSALTASPFRSAVMHSCPLVSAVIEQYTLTSCASHPNPPNQPHFLIPSFYPSSSPTIQSLTFPLCLSFRHTWEQQLVIIVGFNLLTFSILSLWKD